MSPAEAVRHRLAFGRRCGWRFESAWTRAVHCPIAYPGLPKVDWGHDRAGQTEWQLVMEALKPVWRAAYYREPLPSAMHAFTTLRNPTDLREERDPPPRSAFIGPIADLYR